MKKILAVLLVMVMSISLLVACGGSGDAGNKENGNKEDGNSSISQDSDMDENEVLQDDKENGIESYIVSGNEVSYEDEYISLEISELQRNSVFCSVNITVSNKTDQRLGLYPEKWLINGFCVKPDRFGYMEIGPNEEAFVNEVILPIEKLEAIGISNVGELVLQCDLRDASEALLGDNIIYSVLVGYQTAEYSNMDTEMSIALDEIGECEGVKVYGAIVPNGFYSSSKTSIAFAAENTSDETVYVSIADESYDIAIRSFSGKVASGESFILGLWGTDKVSVGDAVKMYVTLTNESNEEVLVDEQEFEWIAK